MTKKEKIIYLLECIQNDAGDIKDILIEVIDEDSLSGEFNLYNDMTDLLKFMENVNND